MSAYYEGHHLQGWSLWALPSAAQQCRAQIVFVDLQGIFRHRTPWRRTNDYWGDSLLRWSHLCQIGCFQVLKIASHQTYTRLSHTYGIKTDNRTKSANKTPFLKEPSNNDPNDYNFHGFRLMTSPSNVNILDIFVEISSQSYKKTDQLKLVLDSEPQKIWKKLVRKLGNFYKLTWPMCWRRQSSLSDWSSCCTSWSAIWAAKRNGLDIPAWYVCCPCMDSEDRYTDSKVEKLFYPSCIIIIT